MARKTQQETFAQGITEYAAKKDEPTKEALAAEAVEDEFVIPEDISDLSVEDLTTLHEKAVETFDALYADGKDLTEEDLTVLGDLTNGIGTLNAEIGAREAASVERSEKAAALAAKVRPENTLSAESETDEPAEEDPEAPAEEDAEAADETDAAETVVASAGARVNLATVRARTTRKANKPSPKMSSNSMKDHVFADETGEGLDWAGMGEQLNRRLAAFNKSQYESAARQKRHIREQKGFATLHRSFPEDLIISSSDPEHVDTVMRRAMDESRLKGNSLVASGGWGAPSEILYEMLELESRDGLFSLPEISVKRGGINYTAGPDFASIYDNITGFHYTEAQDIAAAYASSAITAWAATTAYGLNAYVTLANGSILKATTAGTSGASEPTDPGMSMSVTDGTVTWLRVWDGPTEAGDKPSYKIGTPSFTEVRLETDGLQLTAGLLQSRGFPEAIARVIRGALVARDHRTSGRVLAEVVAGSDKITMTAAQVGAVAPLLDSIEKQVEHYRYIHRLSRSVTLEATFPFWVRGVLRSDLSRRLAMNAFDITDAQIDSWFRLRGIAPQYVYNWQDLSGASSAMTNWPTTVSFTLYTAGTWVKGTDDIISMDTIYDSVLLGQNDYTALFIEDAWFTAKMGHDSRVITVQLTPDGATAAGVAILANGTEGP